MLRHYGSDPDDPECWLFQVDGRVCASLGAVIRVGRRSGGQGHAMGLLRLLPRPVQDWLCRRLARNRYRLLGRTEMCSLPDPALRARLME